MRMATSNQLGLLVVLALFIAAFVASMNALTSSSSSPVHDESNNNTVTYTMRLHQLFGAPDGVNRSMIGVNGGFGWDFVIRAVEGQRLVVHVLNDLDEPTTIHWHGIFQNHSNAYDGASHVTQCPIPAGGRLTYAVKLEQSGTYWWHSHHGPQYIDGLRGPMIIDPIAPPAVRTDEELIVQLSDWYHRQGADVVAAINSPSLDINRPVDIIPDAALVNGRGRFNCSFAAGACTPHAAYTTFHVRRNASYRLRLINTAAFAGFNVSLDGHVMTVVSVDGIDVEPTLVTHLRINVAQRYDVIVHTNASTETSFWLRATMNNVAPLFFLVPPTGQDIYGKAVWSYTNATDDAPQDDVTMTDRIDLDELHLVPLLKEVPPVPELAFNFTIRIQKNDVTNVSGPHVAIDDGPAFPYRYTTTKPTLFAVIDDDPLPAEIHPLVLHKARTSVQILVINYNQGEHPFHMHGHAFWVMAQGTNLARIPSLESLNALAAPLKRDTVAVAACDSFRGECVQPGWTILRVVLDNPGVWLFHCHIEWDMATGMGMTLIVNPSTLRTMGLPRDIQATCA
ncbi:hypothetical protein SDRG_05047 [Saprolegnia diclina VS20]|uniref:Multicopper oxidase n=1 Tax=Saprolegnia diclina (strain VS20) TaxID=1156394 RepID=T0QHM2_SAPDV|nr:hypothetical protein SDRG_05047 [Saprolegnia diclina VS20]EQC37444.1 hypothetical protein SDRG_05047 [Saprolegnia diclina VS20]|eukprot:XP_008608964.1 hypothetical protein SDRG_05047 [Saprolegnia diclina VS20]